MRLTKRVNIGLLCVFCTAFISGCGDSDTEQQAGQTDLEQAGADLVTEPEEPAYVPPPDHLEPFEVSFGFGNPDEVAHFWKWAQKWEFTDEQAVNKEKPGGAVLESRYRLAGDFRITLDGKLSQSWTNSRRSIFEVCGQTIALATWRPIGINLTVQREGNQLTYTLVGQDPVVVELSEDQAGPTSVRLVVYGRHATIYQFDLSADSADRIAD